MEANSLTENINGPAIHIRGAADAAAAPVTTSVAVDSNLVLQTQEGTGIVVDRVSGAVTITDNEINSVTNTGASNQFSLGGIRLNGNGIFVAGAGGKVRIGGDAAPGDAGTGATIGNGGGNVAFSNTLITPERFIYVSQSGDGSSDAVVVRNNVDFDNAAVTGRNTGGEGIIFIDRAQGGVKIQANSLLESAIGNAIYIRGASDAVSAPVTRDVILEANLVMGAEDGAGIAVDRVSGDVSISDNQISQVGNPSGTNRLSLGGIVLDGISILVAGAEGKLRIGGTVAFGGAGAGTSLNHGGGNQLTGGMDSAEGIRLQAVGDGTADAVFIGNNEVSTAGGVLRNAAAINVIRLNGGGEIATNDFLNSLIGLRFENLDSNAGLPMLVRNNRFGGIPGATGTGIGVVDSRVGGLTVRGNGFLSDSGTIVSRAIDIDAASSGMMDAGFNYWGTLTSADPSADVLTLLNRINDPSKVSITSMVISGTAGGIDLDNGAVGNTLTNGALANVAGYQVDGRQLIVLPDELSASTASQPNRVQSGLDRIAASVAAADATNSLQPGAIGAVDPRLVLLNGTYSGGNAVATDANLDGIRFFFENTNDTAAPLLAGGPRLSQGGFTLGAINASFEEGRLTTRDAINFNAGSNLTLNDSLGRVQLTSTAGGINFNGHVTGTGNALLVTGAGISQGSAGTIDAGSGRITLDADGGSVTLNGSITTINATTDALRIIHAAATTLNTLSAANGTVTLGEAGGNALGSVILNGPITATDLAVVSSGDFTNHGKMTVSNDIAASIAGNFLNSASGDIDPVNIHLTLAGGSFTNNGAIASDTLNINGAGDFTNSASGSITLSNDLLAAISGNFANAGTILAADRIRIVSSGGSAMLSGTGTITAGGTGGGNVTPLILAFSNGSFNNTAGTNAISAANDRWLVYVSSFASGSFTPGGIESQSTANAGAGGVRSAFYGRTYASTDEAALSALETTAGFTRGSRFVFADTPSLTLTADNKSRQQGQPNPPFTHTLTGFNPWDLAGESFIDLASASTPAGTSSPAGTYP
ncbi:MAG: hypothetical protein FGM62_06575, partial [Methylobacterium sp.]|nr:hypothetical protein [Methylobacterium sp.]